MKKLLVVCLALIACGALGLAQEAVSPPVVAADVKCEMVGQIEVKTIPAAHIVAVMQRAADYMPPEGFKEGEEGLSLAYGMMMSKGFEALMGWMTKGGQPAGPPLAIYFEDPERTPVRDLTCKIAFPAAANATAEAPLTIEEMPEFTAVVAQYKGPYEGSADVWRTAQKWVEDKGYAQAGAPMEVYLRGPGEKVSPADFLTEIRIPVKKAAAQPAEGSK